MKFKTWDINLKVRLFGEALLDISFWAVFPFLTIYFSDSIGRQTTSLLLILSQALSVITALLGGYFADTYGRKRMMSISVIGEGAGFLIFAIAATTMFHSPYVAFFGFMVASIFMSFYQPASQAMIADVVKPEHRSHVYSIFYMMINIAVVIGPIIGALVFNNYTSQTLLAIVLADLLLLILLTKFGHETAPMALDKELRKAQREKKIGTVLMEQLRNYKLIFKDKVFFLYIIAGVIISQSFMQLDLLFPLYITEVIGDSSIFSIQLTGEQLFGFIVSINGFCVALLTVFFTRLMSRYREKLVFMNSSFLYGIAILLFGIATGPWGAILAIILFSFAELMTVGIQQNFVAKIAPDNKRAMYFSAAGLRYTFGKVIAPLAITLSTLVGYFATFATIAVLAVISGFIYFYMYSLYEKQDRAK
ncbi:MFS transporter [Listeria newyorkensis]|uniref:MFS transporter n=1 Tax=Listeria newyorkensis TaxID=1497681 RepID=A0A841Z0B5_9LIST|nr:MULTISPECIES: MFS transporter [Listeria]KGL46190.1 MFS transporter [Listeriaceae bacterium FSL A5-0209]KGL43409.1 MFS transporter [Listeria newyorkensis]KMT63037.1 putative multidrug resistance protein, integral membrane protein [Listeria newyorkensis]MBC1458267.1 MFS transporter [Listeria newyorkensis]PNP88988.1 MFS transporter [Listeria newyorkensis]